MTSRRGFARTEFLSILVVVLVVAAVLLPLAQRRQQYSSLQQSRLNLRAIIAAQWSYRNDANDQPPMRGNNYTNGSMNGWDTWSIGGKNCSIFWQTLGNGIFDESAYSRPLNHYLTSEKIPVPSGYVNSGAWPNWTFRSGTPTPEDRLSLQIPVFRSPGDRSTRQRNWPNPTLGVSSYDDVGTSYHVNMAWWGQPGLPPDFNQKYNEGILRIKKQGHIIEPQMYVWISDQVGATVPELPVGSPGMPGEFGGSNASVLGFLDGRAEYIQLTPGVKAGPNYRFTLH
ncbi:MAG: hypothetical protein IT437_12710 [Phycisphaerales bacterium]|nr:hypothetical protein [Phycisphaerales bacterium]